MRNGVNYDWIIKPQQLAPNHRGYVWTYDEDAYLAYLIKTKDASETMESCANWAHENGLSHRTISSIKGRISALRRSNRLDNLFGHALLQMKGNANGSRSANSEQMKITPKERPSRGLYFAVLKDTSRMLYPNSAESQKAFIRGARAQRKIAKIMTSLHDQLIQD